MGDQSTVLTTAEARHLLRRSGFGAPPAKVNAFAGMTRGAAADKLLAFTPAKFKPNGKDIRTVHNSWIKYMTTAAQPLQEKLVLFWHDHFATSNSKVDFPKIMTNQNFLLRQFCKGNFKDFVKFINKDAAMMEFLDTVRNQKEQPNENYARELQELFTLGVRDFNGAPNYDQKDIVQIARAFSGWDYNNKGVAAFDPDRHDTTDQFPERGPKLIYQSTGGFGPGGRDYTQPAGEGPAEIDQVIDIIFQHTDSDGKNTVARYIAHKLFTYLGNAAPTTAVVDTLVADSQFDTTFNIGALVRAIFVNDAFYATDAPAPFGAGDLKSVKWPVDYVVTTLRLLNMRLKSKYLYVNGGSYASIRDQLNNMGQVLFEPPSVFGWNWETAWISSATLLARYGFARDVTSARGAGRTTFHPEKLSPELAALTNNSSADPNAIVNAVTDVLGVTDQLTSDDRVTLVNYLTENGAHPTLNLTNSDTRNSKLNGVFALVLAVARISASLARIGGRSGDHTTTVHQTHGVGSRGRLPRSELLPQSVSPASPGSEPRRARSLLRGHFPRWRQRRSEHGDAIGRWHLGQPTGRLRSGAHHGQRRLAAVDS